MRGHICIAFGCMTNHLFTMAFEYDSLASRPTLHGCVGCWNLEHVQRIKVDQNQERGTLETAQSFIPKKHSWD